MKIFIFIGVCLITAKAARLDPQNLCPCEQSFGQKALNTPNYPPAQQIPILKYEHNNNDDGSYNFAYEAGNGIKHDEQGSFRPLGNENGERVVMGSYSYKDNDGKQYTVNYKADSNGFVASGDHLPTPPPIPPEIQESLKLTAPGYNPYVSGSNPQQHSHSTQAATRSNPQANNQQYQGQSFNSPQAPNGGHYQSSTRLIPGGVSAQASYSTGSNQPSTAFNSQSSFAHVGTNQPTYAGQSSHNSPTNTYLPPY